MKNLNNIIVALCLFTLVSCEKYLAEPPAVQADIQTSAQLRALMDNMNAGPRFMIEGNSTAIFGTDDYGVSDFVYKNNESRFSIGNIYYYVFDTDNVINQQSDSFWNGEFNKIFAANLVLELVDEVSGSEQEKKQLKADAYFVRAYSYFNLANYYCLPYAAANMQSLGLPLKTTRIYTESLVRSNLQQTYDFILGDIEKAREFVINDDVQDGLRWRVSNAAIDAFMSRYYLFTGNYDQSIEFSNRALAYSGASLKDFNTIVAGVPVTYTNPVVTLNYSEFNRWSAAQYLNWQEAYYPRFTYNSSQLFIASSNLVNLYNQSADLRYKWLLIPNGGRRSNIIDPVHSYVFFDDGRYIPSGPTIAEVLLNKAEALARTGEVATAMNTVNILRLARYKAGTNSTMVASNNADAISKILEERRRELPAVFRWIDIRRFSVNNYPEDDVTVTRNFFQVNDGAVDFSTPRTYTLTSGSPRYAVPINGTEIINSGGQIQQNQY